VKIAAIVEHRITEGGGFNQALNAILQVRDLTHGWSDLIAVTTVPENISFLRQLGIEAVLVRPSWRDKLLWLAAQSPLLRLFLSRLRLMGSIERDLIAAGVDLVYFVTPSSRPLALQRLNFVVTIWDVCHRDTPEFPEIREGVRFYARESEYRAVLPAAVFVIADSAALAERLAHYYGIEPAKVLVMPFSPSPFLREAGGARTAEVLSKYALRPGYYFYPAQFWAHKNHVRIVQATRLLVNRGAVPVVVFVGSEKGNRRHVEALAARLGVLERIKFLGFIPAEDMQALYEGCRAVVMPTYFGPTNLPPLEAWSVGRPLIYSRQLAEHAGEAALLIDPDNAEELAGAMERCLDPDESDRLVRLGRRRIDEIGVARQEAAQELKRRLRQFALRRECWL
jgi:glycosyltransferase involved in cell wall biosynthesis